MKKSFQFFSLLVLLVLGLSISALPQQASVGHQVKTDFLNPLAECTGTGELIYDDGTFENGYGWNTTVTDGQIVQLFTPTTYPYSFGTFCISLTRNGSSPTFNFDIVVYENSGGAPGTLVTTIAGMSAADVPNWPVLAWYDFDATSIPELTSGDYFIGIKWNASTNAGFYIGADESATTTLHPGYASADGGATWTSNQTYWAGYKAMGMRTLFGYGCGVEAASNPVPADGATDVDINLAEISWTNGAGAVTNELYFGDDPNNLQLVQSGTLATSYSLSGLNYNTSYYWQVNEIGDTCNTMGALWGFTTMQDPNLVSLFFDDFESDTPPAVDGWVITADADTGVWKTFGVPYPNSYTLPCGGECGNVLSADADEDGQSLVSTALIDQTIDGTQYQSVSIEFDNDFNVIASDDYAYVEVSNDGGTTWNIVWEWGGSTTDLRNTHEFIDISNFAALNNFQVRFRSVQPGWDWWWTVDNVQINGWDIIPVELASFTANVSDGNVQLSWITATETNNKGFEVQRSNGNLYQTIGFVQGNGTSTNQHFYSYTDKNVENGSYSYRLRQVDFDGTSEYSQVVEVNVDRPLEYNLAQNYPNPFNPSTKINYELKVDSKVTLQVFDILGQKVATLLNENVTAGNHNVTFDASRLNSGVYLYKIEAKGVDGSNFTSVKKMILTK